MRRLFARSLSVTATLIVTVTLLLFPGVTMPAQASSHREAPLITGDPLADNTDVYAFRSTEAGRDGFVTLIWNYIPFEVPSGGPQFYKFDDTVLYDVKIDNTGDGVEDIAYQFRFNTNFKNPDSVLGMVAPNQGLSITSLTDPNYNEPQTYSVTRVSYGGTNVAMKLLKFLSKGLIASKSEQLLATGLIVPPNNIGSRSTPNYETALAQKAVYNLPGGGRVFAGQRDEGFYIDLGGIFDLLNLHSISDTGGTDSTAGVNVNTIAIEVPIQELTRNGSVPSSPTDPNAVIGVWSTANRSTGQASKGTQSSFTQVSRLGSPLVNEVVIPLGMKDNFNASYPKDDAQFATYVVNSQLAQLLQSVFGITIPPVPRNDLVAIFATGIPAGAVPGLPNYATFLSDGKPHEMLRLNVAIPPTNCNFNDFTNIQQCRLGILGGDLAGFPNGRRVGDDVVDIELRAVAGGTPFTPNTNKAPNNTLGDGVSHNDVPYLTRFPYLGTPQSGNPAIVTPGT